MIYAQENQKKQINDTLQKLERAYKQAANDSIKFLNLLTIGRYKTQRGFNNVEQYLDEALTIYNTQKYDLDTVYLGDIYRLYGSLYNNQGSYTESLKFNHKAKDIYTRLDKKVRIAITDNSLSILYKITGDYRKSIAYGKSAIKINKEATTKNPLGVLRNLGFYHNNIGRTFLKLKETDSAMYHFQTAKDYFEETNYTIGWHRANSNIAEILESQGKLQQSLSIYLEKLESQVEDNYKQGIASSYINISRVKMKLKAYSEALTYIEKAISIAREESIIDLLAKTYFQKAEIYKAMNRYKDAYENISLHQIYKDSLINIDNIKKIQELELTYQFRKEKVKDSVQLVKEREIAEANTELLKQESKIKSQWILFGGLGLLLVFSIIYLIRTQKFTRSKQVLQEQFSQGLINEQEKERTRLARELHDSVGQKLMLLSKNGAVLKDEKAHTLAGNTLEELRSISRSLHPPALENLGVSKAIESLINEIDANTSIFFTHQIDHIDYILPKEETLHLYRIIQEVLSNIVKHANAKTASITVSHRKYMIKTVISDNGKGFDITEKQQNVSLGLRTLLERARILGANLDIDSDKNKGTVISLNIPVKI